jgi:hypothetical protein
MALLGVKKLSSNSTLLYSKEPARLHDSNEANDNLIRVQGAEIKTIYIFASFVWMIWMKFNAWI